MPANFRQQNYGMLIIFLTGHGGFCIRKERAGNASEFDFLFFKLANQCQQKKEVIFYECAQKFTQN
jgi:hypothetical protein